MDQEYHKIKAGNGKSYLLETSRENSLKANLNGWQAMQLFGLLKQASPERFMQMVTEGTIIPFLNTWWNNITRIWKSTCRMAGWRSKRTRWNGGTCQ